MLLMYIENEERNEMCQLYTFFFFFLCLRSFFFHGGLYVCKTQKWFPWIRKALSSGVWHLGAIRYSLSDMA